MSRPILSFMLMVSLSGMAHAGVDPGQLRSANDAADKYAENLISRNEGALEKALYPPYVDVLAKSGTASSAYVKEVADSYFDREQTMVSIQRESGEFFKFPNEFVYLVRFDQSMRLPFGAVKRKSAIALISTDGGKNWGVIDNGCAIQGYMDKEHSEAGFDLNRFLRAQSVEE